MADPSPVIFVVDDDPSVRIAVRRLLLSLRLPVRLCGSAEEFLAEADSTLCGCVILDMSLPGMNGLELQQRLSAGAWKLRIVFITALEEDEGTREVALRGGAVDYLQKPFERDRLLHSVRLAIGATDDART